MNIKTKAEMPQLITLAEIARALGVSRATARRYMSNKTAPNPIKLRGQKLYWVLDEVITWLESKRSTTLQSARNAEYRLDNSPNLLGEPNRRPPISLD